MSSSAVVVLVMACVLLLASSAMAANQIAEVTWYTSYAECCPENANYDPSADTNECDNYNACQWSGDFAALGHKSYEYVSTHNIVAFYDNADPDGEFYQEKYAGRMIRLTQGDVTFDAIIGDTCGNSDCDGCCAKNADQDTGFLVDLEVNTMINNFGADAEVSGKILFEILELDTSVFTKAVVTYFSSYAPCCPNNENYDPDADTTECINYGACEAPGQFAAIGEKSYDYVQQNNLVSLYDNSDPNGDNFLSKYGGKRIRVTKADVTFLATIATTCDNSNCDDCCSNNADPDSGFLLDLELWTMKNNFGEDSTVWGDIYFEILDDGGCEDPRSVKNMVVSHDGDGLAVMYKTRSEADCVQIKIREEGTKNKWKNFNSCLEGNVNYLVPRDKVMKKLDWSSDDYKTKEISVKVKSITNAVDNCQKMKSKGKKKTSVYDKN
eukprot:TRINITY_DN10705_c0_g1_i1.p1 TRINITY_DN10705_c0_g1~~TRINITY_DN10705_c0_g1_i1.p1  ORF type:complete len:439 (-),score=120.94 TRINITY_DN10705_c0_g1_i1:50-1366(-)